MGGERKALIVANDEYAHEALRRLKAPAADARALASVLGDQDIGGFQVEVVLNEPAHNVELRIEDLFADSKSDDLLLLHFSCHGLKSEAGELFFAASNTRPDRLGATAIPAEFIQRCIKSCRARSIVLFLDCCYGGAYGQGVTVRASGSANVLESFPAGKLGGGKGRAVITASSSMEYAFEGNELADNHQQQPSVFTSALVEGLASGEADRDEDGLISLNELYEWVFDKVQEQNPNQTPSRDVEMQGELYLARSRRKRVRALPIPAEVQAALVDSNMFTRLGAVSELRARLNSHDIAAALGAHEALTDLTRTDIKYVGDAALEALAGATIRVAESELRFGELEQGAVAVPQPLHLSGPPLARDCTFFTPDGWVRIQEAADGPRVWVETSVPGELRGSITVKGATGQVVVPVSVDVIPLAPEVEPDPVGIHPGALGGGAGSAEVEPDPVAMKADAVAVLHVDMQPEPVPRPRPDGVTLPPATLVPVADAPALVPPPSITVPSADGGGGRLRLSGRISLAGGALMVVGIALPFRYDLGMTEKAPYLIGYLLLLGALALAGGASTLVARTGRWLGPPLVLASATTATWGAGFLMDRRLDSDSDGYNIGFQLEFVALLLLIAAGCLAAVGLARLDDVHIKGLSRDGRLEWLVVALGSAGALSLVLQAAEVWPQDVWYGTQTAWAAILSIALPVAALLVQPRRVGVCLMAGWIVGAFALAIHYWMHVDQFTNGDTPKIDAYSLTLVALAATTAVWSRRPNKDVVAREP